MEKNFLEELFPLIFFLIIVGVNALKFFIEKGGKAKRTPAKPGGVPPQRAPSTIEQFFERIAEQLEPPARELPAWPEGIERPDYIQEKVDFERAEPEKPIEPLRPVSFPHRVPTPPIAEIQPIEKTASAPMPRPAGHATLSGSQGMRMPSMNPLKIGDTAGRPPFRIGNKKALRKALLGHIVLSPPRALNPSFDNTIA